MPKVRERKVNRVGSSLSVLTYEMRSRGEPFRSVKNQDPPCLFTRSSPKIVLRTTDRQRGGNKLLYCLVL